MKIVSSYSFAPVLVIILVVGVLFSLIYGADVSRKQASGAFFDMLEGKKAEMIIHRVKDPSLTQYSKGPDGKTCLVTINSQQLSKYPIILSTMKEADTDADIDSPDVQDNIYAGYLQYLNTTEAVSLVREYNDQFEHSVQHIVVRERYTDNVYSYNCYFEYAKNQYYVEMNFRSLSAIDDYRGFVPIDITRQAVVSHRWPSSSNLANSSSGNTDDTKSVAYYSFNNTGVWTNNLDKPITLKLSFPSSEDNGQVGQSNEDGQVPSKIVTIAKIFPGMSWDYALGPDYSGLEDKNYHYEIVEYPWIKGDIIVKFYPRCMAEDEARSLYYRSDSFQVKFPSHLPVDYHYVCGLQYDSFMLLETYWNKDKDAVGDFEGSYAFRDQALEEGLLQIFAIKQGGMAHPEVNKTAEDRLEELTQGENGRYFMDAKIVTIKEKHGEVQPGESDNSILAVAYKRNWGGEWTKINILEVFDNKTENHNEGYILRGKMPVEELVKIAQSMYDSNN